METRDAVGALLFLNMMVPGTKLEDDITLVYKPSKNVDVHVMVLPGAASGLAEGLSVLMFAGNGNARKDFKESSQLREWVAELNTRMPGPFQVGIGVDEKNESKVSVFLNTIVREAFDDFETYATLLRGMAQKAEGLANDLKQAGFK